MGPQPRHHSQYHAKLESDSLAVTVTVTVDIMVLTRIPESMIATRSSFNLKMIMILSKMLRRCKMIGFKFAFDVDSDHNHDHHDDALVGCALRVRLEH
jgi:hypothetical protein